MELKLTVHQKLILTFFCFSIAIVGFIIKLPHVFRHYDKELHSLFYFSAALFLNVLFVKRHLIIFFSLLLFGVLIEFAQGYSNKFFRKRIHADFDKEDIYSNLKGLILFSNIWLFLSSVNYLLKKTVNKKHHLGS
jgi:hypothetical protein